jgi:hypothetical protein
MVAVKSDEPAPAGTPGAVARTAPPVLCTSKVRLLTPLGARAVALACRLRPANELAAGLLTVMLGAVTSLHLTVSESQICAELQAGLHSCETQCPPSQTAPDWQLLFELHCPLRLSTLQAKPPHTATSAIPRRRLIKLP